MLIYYKPTEEAIKKINPGPVSGIMIGDDLERAKTTVVIYTLQDHTDKRIEDVYIQVYLYLKQIYNIIRHRVRKDYYNTLVKESEVSFEYRKSGFWSETEWNLNDTVNRHVKWFTTQAILCKTPDYYEDSEGFIAKEDNLEQELEGYVESIEEVCKQEIEQELEAFKDREEE